MFINQKGTIPLLVVIAVFGLIAFILYSNSATFKDKIFSSLFPKPPTQAADVWDEEFVGPFSSWANVKTQYGAIGDGVTDDTAALQAAFNEVGTTGKSSVLYLPAGTYRITNTLKIGNKLHVGIIGEDPATTILKWDGADLGIMMWIDGLAYSMFNRITWDGSSKAAIAVDQSKAANDPCCFDTGNEYVDDVFKDVKAGIRGGHYGFGFAETSVIRSHFIRNSEVGILTRNFNALDLFVWYSSFEDGKIGLGNNIDSYLITPGDGKGAGNFFVFNSIFKNNSSADIYIGNTGVFSFRNNYSIGSHRFFVAGPIGSASAPITFQNNTIIDPKGPADYTQSVMASYNPGSQVFLDNVIKGNVGTVPPVITVDEAYTDAKTADAISLGNTFTLDNPYFINGDLLTADDKVVTKDSLNPVVPTLPGTPPNRNRQVFEVPVGSGVTTIQNIINQASQLNGQRPVVHIPAGNYNINQTIVVPGNNDLQIIGDGGNTKLTWTGGAGGKVMQLLGPSRAILRDFYINAAGQAEGIVVEDADQVGGRIFMEQANVSRADGTIGGIAGFFVDGIDHSLIELHDFLHSGADIPQKVGVKVVGGPLSALDQPTQGRVNIFAGASSNNEISYDLSNGGKLLVEDIWYETNLGPKFVNLTGKGIFTFNGGNIATANSSSTQPAININNFDGKATFLTAGPPNLVVDGDGSKTKVLVAANTYSNPNISPNFINNSANAQVAFLNNRQATVGGGSVAVSDQVKNVNSNADFVKEMMAQVRTEKPQPLTTLPQGVTDLRVYRVSVERAPVGMHIKAGTNTGPVPTPTVQPTPSATVAPPPPPPTPTPTPNPTFTPTPIPTLRPTSTPNLITTQVEAEIMSLIANSQALQVLNDSLASAGKYMMFWSNASSNVSFNNQITTNSIVVRARGDQCNGAPNMIVRVDNIQVYSGAVSATSWTDYIVARSVPAGMHNVSVEYNNDFTNFKGNSGKTRCDRNLRVDKISFQ